jgi:flagellin
MLSINTNLMANNAALNLGKSYVALGTSVQRLSSGLRINSAADDAAGMAVSSQMSANVAVLQQGSRNTQDAISMLQTAGGALGTDQDLLTRMNQLAEQSSTGTYTDSQRTLMNNEFQQDIAQISQNATAANFNGVNVLTSLGNVTFNTGLGTGNTISFAGADMTAAGLGLGNAGTQSTETVSTGYVGDPNATYLTGTTGGGSFSFQFGAEAAITANFTAATTYSLNQIANVINTASQTASSYNAATVVDNNGTYSLQLSAKAVGNKVFSVGTNTPEQGGSLGGYWGTTGTAAAGNVDISTSGDAINALASLATAMTTRNTYNSTLGYMSNRLSAAENIVNVQAQNLQAAVSGITDVDTATETSNLTRNSVLTQAGIAMLAQANTMPQMALKLLQ